MSKDNTVIPFRQPDAIDDPLTELAREGARRMLAQALIAEADAFVAQWKDLKLPDGRDRVVRHGHGPQRTIQTGVGPVEVRRAKVRDRGEAGAADKIRFSSSILPKWARRTKSLDALLPVLYLRGVSTGDFQEALAALLGKDAPNLSPSVIARLTAAWQADYDAWRRRDLSARGYVYVWADEVYLQARMEDAAECMGFSSPPSFVYAIGGIDARFPQLSVEKEFAQVTGRSETQGLTDRQALHGVLTRPENRYLARHLCWVMSIEGIETYILLPRDPADVQLLIEALRPAPSLTDVDVVIGTRGPIAPPTLCNGLIVPIVVFDQIYSFDVDTLMRQIPRPNGVDAEQFRAVTEEVFSRVMQVGDNVGATDRDRALNYLAVRYPAVYASVAEAHARNESLSAVDVLLSALSTTRRIVEVVFSFTNRATDVVDKRFVRVDVTEEFPFLVTKLSPYFSR